MTVHLFLLERLTALAEDHLARPCIAQTVIPAAHIQYPAAHGFPSERSQIEFVAYKTKINHVIHHAGVTVSSPHLYR